MPRLHAELATTVNSRLAAVPPAQIRAFDEEISAVPTRNHHHRQQNPVQSSHSRRCPQYQDDANGR